MFGAFKLGEPGDPPRDRRQTTMGDHYDVVEFAPPKRRRVEAAGELELDTSQSAALRDVVERRRSIFLTGGAGVGKSLVLKRLVAALEAADVNVAVTASTGRAAVELELEATTLHSFFALGDCGDKPLDHYEQLLVTRRGDAVKRIRALDVLVIEEISMVEAKLFDLLSALCGRLRRRRGALFGGLQVVLCGDFAQLPPVEGRMCFHARAWQTGAIVTHDLDVQHRQACDAAYARLLARARFGRLTPPDIALLRGRIATATQLRELGDAAVRLYAHNALADEHNAAAMARIGDAVERRTYETVLDVEPGEMTDAGNRRAAARALAAARRWFAASKYPALVELRVGARVLLTRNVDVAAGLANGALGTVVGFEDDAGGDGRLPLVTFDGAGGVPVVVQRATVPFPATADYRGHFDAMPLMPAWAISIHRAQGMTIRGALVTAIGAGEIFAGGQAYVAMSRVTALNSLYFIRFSSSAVFARREVLEFYGVAA